MLSIGDMVITSANAKGIIFVSVTTKQQPYLDRHYIIKLWFHGQEQLRLSYKDLNIFMALISINSFLP